MRLAEVCSWLLRLLCATKAAKAFEPCPRQGLIKKSDSRTWRVTGTSMKKLQVGNAPCSWGTLEFEGVKSDQITFGRMLDELAETGYTGTELGDWGYMPTEPEALKQELGRRRVVMLGAFVPVALKDRSAHAAGIATALRT